MKIFISLSVVILFLSVTLFSSSCTKETVEVVHVTDTVKLIYQDSIIVDFVYGLDYSSIHEDSTRVHINAVATCKNLPSNATFNWQLLGPKTTMEYYTNSTFIYTIDEYATYPTGGYYYHSYKGQYVLWLLVKCPDTERNYSVAKTLQVKLKY